MSQATERKRLEPTDGREALVIGFGWWGRGSTVGKALREAPGHRNGPCTVWHVPPGAYVNGMGALICDGNGPEPDLVAKAEVASNRRGLVRIQRP